MKNATVFITEKPSILRRMAPVLSGRWEAPIYAITTYFLGLYEFRYPRGLRISDYPIIKEPEWKPRSLANPPAWRIQEGEVASCTTDPATLLRNASTIIFACDPDHSGATAFNVLIEQSLGILPSQSAWPAMHVIATNESAITQSIEAMGATSDEWFTTISDAGQAKRFFDFNFNANALVVLSSELRKVGCPDKQSKLSKYGLQLLYSLRDESAPDTSSLIKRMETWKGTGRHQAIRLGSPASMSGIIDNLTNAQLIELREDLVKVSVKGERFLSLLHPDCRDPDLPARLQSWMSEWPTSRPAMERYLKTFFGKQRRFSLVDQLNQ